MPKKVKTESNVRMENEDISFESLFSDAKRVKHDRHELSTADKRISAKKRRVANNSLEKQASALFEFSDGFEASFASAGPLKYVKDGERSDGVKRLRNGDIPPDLVLDLHGLSAESSKHEIAALIYEAQRKHFACVCIVHGIGAGILKRKVPSWLVQHPFVLGFHQAPLEWGGKGAILVLVKQNQDYQKFD
jgi:DNA-nicking Smr family endonuclease